MYLNPKGLKGEYFVKERYCSEDAKSRDRYNLRDYGSIIGCSRYAFTTLPKLNAQFKQT